MHILKMNALVAFCRQTQCDLKFLLSLIPYEHQIAHDGDDDVEWENWLRGT